MSDAPKPAQTPRNVAFLGSRMAVSIRTNLFEKFQALSQVVKFVTRTYSSKPYAEVEDSSCLRSGCHSTRLLQGPLVTRLSGAVLVP